MPQTVEDFIPASRHSEHAGVPDRHGTTKVVEIAYGTVMPFPSEKFRYVFRWAVLADGLVMGHYENPRIGASFRLLGRKAVANFYQRHLKVIRPTSISA